MTPAGSSSATRNLALATVAFGFAFTAWTLIAPLAKRFQNELGLSNTKTTVLIAVPILVGSLLRIPVGTLTDRIGGRRMFAAVLAITAPAAVFLGYAGGFWALVGVGVVLGVSGSSLAIGVPFVAGWFGKEQQGFALGVFGLGNIGTAIAALTAPAVVNVWGLTALGWATGILLLLAASAFWVAAEDPPRRRAPDRYRDVLRAGWRLYRLALFYFVTLGGFVSMAVLLPKLLVDWFGYSLVDAGLRAAGFAVVGAGGRPVGGWLADRFGAPRVLVAVFAGIAVDAAALAVVAASPRIVPVTIASLTLAAFLGVGSGAVLQLVPAEFPENAGAASGIVGAAGGVGGFFPPLMMGIVKDATGSYTLGFVGLLAFGVLSLLLVAHLLRAEGSSVPWLSARRAQRFASQAVAVRGPRRDPIPLRRRLIEGDEDGDQEPR